MPPAIHLHGIGKDFGSVRALDGLGLSVERGEIVGLLGPNGSGKTTTLRILAGYLRPDRGEVRVCGRVGYLPEKAPLYDALPVTGQLDFVAGARGLNRAARRREVDRALADYGLEAVRNRRIGTLSKGFRQRVGLAQATLGDPEVLLLDEATNGLDPLQMVEVRALIRRAGQGRAVLFSSHLMQEVAALCARVYILHAGRAVAERRLEGEAPAIPAMADVHAGGIAAAALIHLLSALPGVAVVSGADTADGAVCRCRLDPGDDPRGRIAAAVVERASLLALMPVAPTLEDVFLDAIRPAGPEGIAA
ncbi:MAG TPA: ABC transporter ATP-binding protein [Azospirillum sp.]|nr:ABC transporter ATP-binding protein [Azospirillum sp.]